MGVVDTAKRAAFGTVALAVVVYAGFHLFTKQDISKDRKATVEVRLGPTDRTARATLLVTINGAIRSEEVVSEEKPVHSETFWVRPGETVRVGSSLVFGKASITCTIFMDGVVAAGPRTGPEGFEAACSAAATA